MENRDLIVFPIDKNERSSVKWERTDEYDIMKTDTKLRGGDNMHQETYSKNGIDLKFENLSDRMDNKFELLSQKVDNGFSNQVLQINNSFSEFKQALKDEQKKNAKNVNKLKKNQ